MSEIKVINEVDCKNVIEKFNSFHDASLKTISFEKARSLDDDGSLIYENEDFSSTRIVADFLHSSYLGAKVDQIIKVVFNNVKDFSFIQRCGSDYSDIYDMKYQTVDGGIELVFLAMSKMEECLRVVCEDFDVSEI